MALTENRDSLFHKSLKLFFIKTVKSLSRGYGLSRFRIVKALYNFLFSLVKRPSSKVEVNGFIMHLDSKDTLGLSVWGVYEKLETELIKKEIKKGHRVIDIGANIGYYTLLFSRLVGEKGKVFAFEPDPTNFSLLKRNIEENSCGNVILEQKAVGERVSSGKLYLSEENKGDHRIYEPGEKRESVVIEIISLDEYFKNTDSIDFIKMDVQGAEMKVLRGMEEILKKGNEMKIAAEFWPKALKKAGDESRDMLTLLLSNGFKIYEIDERKGMPTLITDTKSFLGLYTEERGNATNLFCVRK